MNGDNKVAAVSGEKDIFLIINGMKIAKRENDQWTSLVPGYKVRDYSDTAGISVEVDRDHDVADWLHVRQASAIIDRF